MQNTMNDIEPDTPYKDEMQCGGDEVLLSKIDAPRVSDQSEADAGLTQARALLPKNTLVRITGNARTNPALIGQQGMTLRAMGLGGWHWIKLEVDGREVKLQRNALTVLQLPEFEEESSESEAPIPPVLPAALVARPSRLASSFTASAPRQSSRLGQAGMFSLEAELLPMAQQPSDGEHAGRVDLSKLATPTLERYCATYNVDHSRKDVAQAASRHFAKAQVDELDVLRKLMAVAGRGGGGW